MSHREAPLNVADRNLLVDPLFPPNAKPNCGLAWPTPAWGPATKQATRIASATISSDHQTVGGSRFTPASVGRRR